MSNYYYFNNNVKSRFPCYHDERKYIELAISSKHYQLLRWLKIIVDKRNDAVKTLKREVAKTMGRIEVQKTFKNGHIINRIYPYNIYGAYAFGIALILNDEKLIKRLRCCKAPGCGRFGIDFTGKPKRFCNKDHKEKFDAMDAKFRVQRWRDRQKDN